MFAKNLFNDLMKLVNEENSPFYFVDQYFEETYYRVFSYRLANYTDFCKPNALECRGHMFEVTDKGEFISLISLPMAKFFNYNELLSYINTPESLLHRAKVAYDRSELSEELYFKLLRDYKK